METTQYREIADKIFGCSASECPLHFQVDHPGCYPKFGAGERQEAILAIITMNPGSPDARQSSTTRNDSSRQQMHENYEAGLLKYHREARGGGIDLAQLVAQYGGIRWSSVYYTELAKCVTTKAESTNGVRKRALSVCSSRYLADELAALPQLEYIICLGGEVETAVERLVHGAPALRKFRTNGHILKSPHPAAFGQRFRHEFPAVLAQVRTLRDRDQ